MSRLVGYGVLGRVYRPNKVCANGTQLCPADGTPCVSKVFNAQRDAETEAANYASVTEMDPRGRFTPKFYGICDSEPHIVEEDAGKVTLAASAPFLHALPLHELLAAATPLLEGLAVMARHGAAHNDIHARNIVFQTPKGPMRLIDFGFFKTYGAEAGRDVAAVGRALEAAFEGWLEEKTPALYAHELHGANAAMDLFGAMKSNAVGAQAALAAFVAIADEVRDAESERRRRSLLTLARLAGRVRASEVPGPAGGARKQ